MADNNALLATALLSAQRKNDPAENSRRYAQLLMQQSLQTPNTPVRSPIEGIARALQQGIGGLIGGIQNQRDLDRQALTSQGLLDYANATTDEQRAAAQEKLKGADPSIVGALAAQQIGLNQAQRLAGASASNFGAAYQSPGGGSGLGAPITPQSTAPLPAPQTGQQTEIPGQDPYQKVLSANESSGNPNAVNPQSKAGGLYQFMPQTWNSVRQNNPNLNLPATVGEASVEQQNAAEQAFRAQNATDLKNNGIEPTPANLYLAHRAGSGGAAALIKADPNAPMSAVAPQSWLAQNPDMRTTVGQFLGMTQQRFPATLLSGGGPSAQPGAPPLATMPSGTKIDPSIPAPPFMQTGAPGGAAVPKLPDGTPITDGAAPPTATLNVPAAVPPAAIPPAAAPPAAPPTVGAVPAAPPTVPMPAPTQEQITRYQRILADPNSKMTAAEAHQALNAELRNQQQQQQAIATETWRQQKAEETARTASVRKAPELFVANTLNDYKTNIRPAAEQAVAGIQSGYQIRQLLDQGAFTGAGAGSAVAVAHIKQVLGMDPNAKLAPTQVLQSQLASGVLQGIGKLSAGASKADNEFIQNAPGITWDEQALRKLLDISQREMQRRIDVHDKAAANIRKFEGMNAPGIAENFQLEKPPSYEEWQKQNAPQAAAPAPGTTVTPGAAAPVAPVRVTTPEEARKLPSGTPIILPDGSTGKVP